MKRAAILMLVLCLATCICQSAPAAGSAGYTIPEQLKTVSASVTGLSLPDPLPPYVEVNAFTVQDGVVHLELGNAVPKLRITEQNMLDGIESTIFSKKNATGADAHMVGKEDSVFIVRMIWQFDGLEYVREYSTWSGDLTFSRCSTVETLEPSAYGPYTSAERVIAFNEKALPIYETITLAGEKDRFTRTASYGFDGSLISTDLIWGPDSADDQLRVTVDADGRVTALTCKQKKNQFYAESVRVDKDPDTASLLSGSTLDAEAFEREVRRKYPQLARGLVDYGTDGEQDPALLELFGMYYEQLPDPQSFLDTAEMTDPEPATITDLGPATATDLQPATMTDLGPATMTDLKPATATDLDPATLTDLRPATMTDLDTGTDDSDTGMITDDYEEIIPDENLTPIPGNALLWSLNFGDFLDSSVYAFITTDPLFVIRGGKVILNPDAKDVNGDPIGTDKKDRVTAPAFEVVTVE